MSSNLTLDDFAERPTPEQLAQRNANAEIREEAGKLKNKLQGQIRDLRRKRGRENAPLARASLDEQIAKKEQEIEDLKWVSLNASTGPELALQKHVRGLINWDGIMKKHLGNIPAPTTPATPATPPTPTGDAS